jgi:hypothetical protein
MQDNTCQTKTAMYQDLINVVTEMEYTKKHLYTLLVPSYKKNQKHTTPVCTQQMILKKQQEKKQRLENSLYTIDNLMHEKGIDLSDTLLFICHKQLESIKGFTHIPFSISNTLTHIDLSHNALTYIPWYIFRCPSLTTLNLSHNAIALVTYYSEKEQEDYVIHRNTTLTNLDISYNHMHSFDFTKQWIATPSLAYLNLSHNPLVSYKWDQTPWKLWQKRGFNYAPQRPIIDIRNTSLAIDAIEKLLHCYAQKNTQTNKHMAFESMILYGVMPAFLACIGTYITGHESIQAIGLTISAFNALWKTAAMTCCTHNEKDKKLAQEHIVYQ